MNVGCALLAAWVASDKHYSFGRMTLLETFQKLPSLPSEGVIYAERINGSFRPESRCIVLKLTEEQLCWPISKVSSQLCPGLDYFVETDIALPFTETSALGNSTQQLERLIQYAENDA
jgi:hypothetical protein